MGRANAVIHDTSPKHMTRISSSMKLLGQLYATYRSALQFSDLFLGSLRSLEQTNQFGNCVRNRKKKILGWLRGAIWITVRNVSSPNPISTQISRLEASAISTEWTGGTAVPGIRGQTTKEGFRIYIPKKNSTWLCFRSFSRHCGSLPYLILQDLVCVVPSVCGWSGPSVLAGGSVFPI